MNIIEIQEQLRLRVAEKVKSTPQRSPANLSGADALKQLRKRIEGIQTKAEALGHLVTDELNQILEENGIDFSNEEEKERFVSGMRATVAEIMKQHFKV